MEPVTQATVAYYLNSNIVYCEFAKAIEPQLVWQIKQHYNSLPGFRLEFPSSVRATICPNSNFSQADVLQDLAELLKSIVDTAKVRWSWACGVEDATSDSLEDLIKTMPKVENLL